MLTHKIQSSDLMSLFLTEESLMKNLIPYCEKHNKEVLTSYTFGILFTLCVYIEPINTNTNTN